MELALGDYLVNDVLETVRASLRSLASGKGLDFVVSAPADLPARLRGRQTHRPVPREPGRERDQVHEGGARGDRGRAAWRHPRLPRDRHRDRDPRGPARKRLLGVPAGGRHHQPRIRRHGPRAQHHQEVRRAAWGPHLGGEHAGRGIDVLVRGPGAGCRTGGSRESEDRALHRGQRVQPEDRPPASRLDDVSAPRSHRRRAGAWRPRSKRNPTSSSWTSSFPTCRASTPRAGSVRIR